MKERRPRLLFLGFGVPQSLQRKHPGVNPAGTLFEHQLTAALDRHFEIERVMTLPFPAAAESRRGRAEPGDARALWLEDRSPELWHRLKACHRLKAHYRRRRAAGWTPDAVLVYNFSPVYNEFVCWLRTQADRPRLILLLLDSTQLGASPSAWKRFRHRFKPLAVPESEMLGQYDGCIGLSRSTSRHLSSKDVPFLWMPGACDPSRTNRLESGDDEVRGPIRFCYFGALAAHAGVLELTRNFLETRDDSELHVSGYGRLTDAIAALAARSPRIHFHGWLPDSEDCLRLGRACDVLVNPRPPGFGNENNFPSKLFDYVLCERAILTSRVSDVEDVLGPEAFYFDPHDYDTRLVSALEQLAVLPRRELRRRGAAIRNRVVSEFTWPRQAERIAQFILAEQA